MTNTITREQIRERLDNGLPTTLVEALPARYYDQGHLPGAVNVPHDQIKELAPDTLPDKHAFVVVYCASIECRNSSTMPTHPARARPPAAQRDGS